MGHTQQHPVKVYMAYATLAMPLAFLSLPLYIYLPTHYASLPGLGLALSGLVFFIARLMDLVSDPIVGGMIDRYRHRISYRAIVLASVPLLVYGVWLLFLPPNDAGPLYLFFSVSITYFAWTLLSVPYYAWGAELAGDKRGHVRLAAWREAGVILGMLLALLAPIAAVSENRLSASLTWMISLLCVSLVSLWLVPSVKPGRGVSSGASLRRVWRDTTAPVRKLLALHFFNTLANGVPATLFLLYAGAVLGLSIKGAGIFLLVYFVPAIIALPVWVRIAKAIGSAVAWRYAVLLAAISFIPAVFLGIGDAGWFLLICVLTGITAGADIALPASMQAELAHQETVSMKRPRTAAIFGLWGMVSKLALACAVGISFPLLDFLTGPLMSHSEEAVLPWLYAGISVPIKLWVAKNLFAISKDLEVTHDHDASVSIAVSATSGNRV